MASPTQWTWVWVNSRSWWLTGRPGMLQLMGLQRVGHDWATELILITWLPNISPYLASSGIKTSLNSCQEKKKKKDMTLTVSILCEYIMEAFSPLWGMNSHPSSYSPVFLSSLHGWVTQLPPWHFCITVSPVKPSEHLQIYSG